MMNETVKGTQKNQKTYFSHLFWMTREWESVMWSKRLLKKKGASSKLKHVTVGSDEKEP